MPSLNNTTDGFHSGHPRRAYITTSAFNNDFYKYTTSVNQQTFVTTGTLSAVVGATAANCPANRILRENGRRLYKDANPGISTLLVGVYDSVSGLMGFIDPNSPRFAMYNGDKSVYQDNGVDPNGSLTDQGPPIYTRGTVTAGSGVTVTTGGVTVTAGGLTINGGAVVETVSSASYTGNSPTFDLTTGNIFVLTAVTGALTLAATGGSKGMVYYVSIAANGAYAITPPASTAVSVLTTVNGTILLTAVRTA